MNPLALKKWEFSIWGCTDGRHTSSCEACKLDKWECFVFKEETSHKFLYTAEGDF